MRLADGYEASGRVAVLDRLNLRSAGTIAPQHALLETTDLACTRAGRVLFSGLNFCLGKGEALWVSGPNGSGKTSLLRILCGLARAETGSVFWKGVDVTRRPQFLQAELAYLAHSSAIKAALTPAENLRFHLRLRSDCGRMTVEDALELVGLANVCDVPCRHLSAGQQRRVALARLLVCRATLWVLDEPLTSLDAEGCRLVTGTGMINVHLAGNGIAVLTSHQPIMLPGRTVRRVSLQADP